MQTYYCKACRKLEQTDRKVNLLNCSKVAIDGVEYNACYLHPAVPVEFNGIPAMGFNNDREAHALLNRLNKRNVK